MFDSLSVHTFNKNNAVYRRCGAFGLMMVEQLSNTVHFESDAIVVYALENATINTFDRLHK